MKIAVLGGAGAMGSALGARLYEAGGEVTLIEPGEVLAVDGA
jgi:predicted dinucleotide-binding enzyme